MIVVGMAHGTDSEKIGRHAARSITGQLAGAEKVSWALVFCGGRHAPEAVLDGIRSELGNIDLYGGSTSGIITSDYLGYSGYECGIIAFRDPLTTPRAILSDKLAEDEFTAGLELARTLELTASPGDTVLLFYDNLKSSNPTVLHLASRLLKGFQARLQRDDLNIIGAGLLGDFAFHPSFVFNGSRTVKHAAMALTIPGNILQSQSTIMHGCIPVSSFYEITKISGPVLFELNGRPALEVIADNLGIDIDLLPDMTRSMSLTIGKKYGDPYAPFDENQYINRLIVGSDPRRGSVALFEDDFEVGDRIQIMSRDNTNMLQSVRTGTAALLESLKAAGKRIRFAFYIDCAGRAGKFSGCPEEEAALVAEKIPRDVPFLGFYSGVEIATLDKGCRPLDWTGLLTVFSDGTSNG